MRSASASSRKKPSKPPGVTERTAGAGGVGVDDDVNLPEGEAFSKAHLNSPVWTRQLEQVLNHSKAPSSPLSAERPRWSELFTEAIVDRLAARLAAGGAENG